MELINFENNKISLALLRLNLRCNKFNKFQRPYIYLLMSFNIYLGPLVKVVGATSSSTILLFDVDVDSFFSYIYVPTP